MGQVVETHKLLEPQRKVWFFQAAADGEQRADYGPTELYFLQATENKGVIEATKVPYATLLNRAFGISILALVIALYAGEVGHLASTWMDHEDLSYGMLVPPVAVFVAWIQRRRVLSTPAETDLRGLKTMEQAKRAGELLAARAKDAGIEACVFDRGGYKYHGRVKALADGAREGGLRF